MSCFVVCLLIVVLCGYITLTFQVLPWLQIVLLVGKESFLGFLFSLSLGAGGVDSVLGNCFLHMMSFINTGFLLHTFCLVYWSCQFIARASNTSLKHWQQMGGVNINEDIVIDKSIHKSINSRSSVLKVKNFQLPTFFIYQYYDCNLSRESVTTQNQCSICVHILYYWQVRVNKETSY